MNPSLLLEWWNLIFIAPFAVALIYLGLYVSSGWTFGDPDVEADASPDVNIDADADVAADLALGEPGVEFGADGQLSWESFGEKAAQWDQVSEGGKTMPTWLAMMHLLGIGKIPVSLLLMILLMSWGIIGFVTNAVLVQRAEAGGAGPEAIAGEGAAGVYLVSLPVALIGSLLATSLVARLIHRFLPLNESYASRRPDLVRRRGEVISRLDSQFGRVAVRDQHGDRQVVPCRTGPEAAPIEAGAQVVLVRYCPRERFFYAVEAGWWEERAQQREIATKARKAAG